MQDVTGCNRMASQDEWLTMKAANCNSWPLQAQGACLVQGHLHGKALIVYVGDRRSIHIQQDETIMVCDDAASLAVDLV